MESSRRQVQLEKQAFVNREKQHEEQTTKLSTAVDEARSTIQQKERIVSKKTQQIEDLRMKVEDNAIIIRQQHQQLEDLKTDFQSSQHEVETQKKRCADRAGKSFSETD